MLSSRVASTIRLHRIFQPAERVLVAVSGGPDSLALLSLLRDLLPTLPLHLTVAHFDHGWRPDSASDAQFVADLAHRWGYAALAARADPALPHTEAAARDARYQFLRDAAARAGCTTIALGHTRDDQVETLLLHLLRGSGSRGLAAMGHRSGDLARPLLDVPRGDLEDYLTSRGLTPRRDSTNDDPRFARNRLRQILLPAIDAFEPSARRLLAQTAEILGNEDRLLEEQVDQFAAGILEDRAAFDALPPALQRRLLRRDNPEAGFLETEARRRRGNAVPTPTSIPAASPQLLVSTCACDRASFRARDPIGHLDADRVQMPLRVASRNPGDRMQSLGMNEAKRLQDILVDARIPRHLRDALPIVCDREEIVWIPAVSVAQRKRVTAETSRQLHLEMASG